MCSVQISPATTGEIITLELGVELDTGVKRRGCWIKYAGRRTDAMAMLLKGTKSIDPSVTLLFPSHEDILRIAEPIPP